MGVLTATKSFYKPWYRDRRFRFSCAKLPAGIETEAKRGWDQWTEWDAEWKKECGKDEVLSGLQSYHNDGKEDRRWKRRCSKLAVSTPKALSFEVAYAADKYR